MPSGGQAERRVCSEIRSKQNGRCADHFRVPVPTTSSTSSPTTTSSTCFKCANEEPEEIQLPDFLHKSRTQSRTSPQHGNNSEPRPGSQFTRDERRWYLQRDIGCREHSYRESRGAGVQCTVHVVGKNMWREDRAEEVCLER